jgi:hypothetical protein
MGIFSKLLVSLVHFMGSKEMETTVPYTANCTIGCGAKAGMLWTTVLTIHISHPVISISLDNLKSSRLARILQQMPT